MKTKIFYLIISFVLLINIGPYLIYQEYEAASPSFDYYNHVIGANQILQENRIPYEQDLRIPWDSNLPLSYPPGFPLIIAVLSAATGISTITIGTIMIFWNILLMVLLIMVISKHIEIPFNPNIVYALAILIGFMQITGYTSQGINFFVPTVFGAFLITIIAYVNLKQDTKYQYKTVITSILISVIISTHRASTLVLILLSFNLMLFYIYYKQYRSLLAYIISSLIGIIIALPVFIFRLFDTGAFNRFSFGFIAQFLNKYIATAILLGFLVIFVLIYRLSKPKNINKKTYLHGIFSKITLKNEYYPLIMIFILLVIFAPWFWAIYSNFSELYSSNPYTFLTNAWQVLNNSDLKSLKSLLYIWHIGLLPLVFFVPGVILVKKFSNKKLFANIGMIGLLTISEIYIIELFIGFSNIPERILFYISIIYSVITAYAISYYWRYRLWKVVIILLLIVNVIVSASGGMIKNVPFPSNTEFQNINYIQESGLSNNNAVTIIAPWYYSNPLKAYNTTNTLQIFDYDLELLLERGHIDQNKDYAVLIDHDLFRRNRDTRRNIHFFSNNPVNKIYTVNDKEIYYYHNTLK